jgi:hypothetical protein
MIMVFGLIYRYFIIIGLNLIDENNYPWIHIRHNIHHISCHFIIQNLLHFNLYHIIHFVFYHRFITSFFYYYQHYSFHTLSIYYLYLIFLLSIYSIYQSIINNILYHIKLLYENINIPH